MVGGIGSTGSRGRARRGHGFRALLVVVPETVENEWTAAVAMALGLNGAEVERIDVNAPKRIVTGWPCCSRGVPPTG